MNYQKPTLSPVSLQAEAAGCSPCVLITVAPPPVRASVTVGDQTVEVSLDGVKPITVTSPTSGGCPTTPIPGTPTVGGIDSIQLPTLRDLIGNGATPVAVDLPPAIAIAHLPA